MSVVAVIALALIVPYWALVVASAIYSAVDRRAAIARRADIARRLEIRRRVIGT